MEMDARSETIVKADVTPLRSHQPDWSCKAVPIASSSTSPARRRFLFSLLANAKKKLKVQTARPSGDRNIYKNEVADSANHDIGKPLAATTPSTVQDNLDKYFSDVPGLSDDDEMPGLSRPGRDSDEE